MNSATLERPHQAVEPEAGLGKLKARFEASSVAAAGYRILMGPQAAAQRRGLGRRDTTLTLRRRDTS